MNNPPFQYVMCINDKCPDAKKCLRYQCAQQVDTNQTTINIVSPRYLASLHNNTFQAEEFKCPMYRSNAPVPYARGFIQMLKNLPQVEAEAITKALSLNMDVPCTFASVEVNDLSNQRCKTRYMILYSILESKKPLCSTNISNSIGGKSSFILSIEGQQLLDSIPYHQLNT